MGTCLCKGHKEYLQSTPNLSAPVLQSSAEGGYQSSGMTFSGKGRDSGYGIGELATSSLIGLVATIKEHITKPTAMAQGRVAHLIEWKGWSAGGGAGCDWRREGRGWGGAGAELAEDEQLYSHLAEEIKAARFAAGVAEQFALAEASMCAWSPQQQHNEPNGTYAPLQDPDGLFFSRILLDDVGAPQRLYSISQDVSQDSSPLPLPPTTPSCLASSPWQPDAQHPLQERRTFPPDSIRQTDSGSLSEDEVFYN
ncbi:protein FAM131C-like isoform X2 [Anguilla rostrata]